MHTYTHKYICCSMYARVKILSPDIKIAHKLSN